MILEINQELLYESIQLQNNLQELKKEESAVAPTEPNAADQTRKLKEQEAICQQDYAQYGFPSPAGKDPEC
jgi:hypothetical protein